MEKKKTYIAIDLNNAESKVMPINQIIPRFRA